MSKRYALYYNKETIGDCLMIVFESNTTPTKVEKNDNVVSLYAHDELIGVNIFNISQIMKIKAHGFIPIIDENVLKIINSILQNANIEPLDPNIGSGFKVALIEEIEEHPDSEHLHICKVNVGSEEKLQIVCGAYNAREGLRCVCATPYTFMPNGQQIIPNKLLGIESFGMLCSGRELGLEGFENKRGLLELDDSYLVGNDFFKD